MKHLRMIGAAVIFIFVNCLVNPLTMVSAEEETTPQTSPVVVTATRIDTPMDQIGKSVSVIEAADIESNVDTQIGDLLDTVPSIRVRQNGGLGTFSPVHIRGSTPSQVLLLIDGFPVVDASNFGGDSSDLFQNLFMDDIQRIEIVRGPLSTLYGADALGGTINLITKKGEEKEQARVFFEGGTKNTFREAASYSGKEGAVDYAVHVIRNDSNGLDDHDVFNATTLSTRVGADLAENLRMDNYLRYTRSRVNFDEFGNPPDFKEIDDPTRLQTADTLFWGLNLTYKISADWEQKLRYSYNLVETDLDDEIDSTDLLLPGLLIRNQTEGNTHNLEWLQNYYGIENHTLSMGLEYERQEADVRTNVFGIPRGRTVEDVDNKAIFFQDQIALWEKFFLTSGLRVDRFASFGTTVNYAFSLAYLLKEIGTKLKANVGTAFNDPSLTQLFDPVLGNPNLEPEEVIGFDFGVEQKLIDDKLWLSATFFRQDYDNLITISRVVTASGIRRQAINSGKALAQGLELESKYRVCPNLNVGVNYTLTDSELEQFDTRIPEIPDSLLSVFADARLWQKLRCRLNVDFVDDSLIAPVRGFPKNEDHATVDLSVIYDVCAGFNVFGRVENLFDNEYRDDTLEAPGFFAFGGFTLKL